MALEDQMAAADSELAALKARAEAAEARAVEAEKKLQDAQASQAATASWLEQHVNSIKAVLPT